MPIDEETGQEAPDDNEKYYTDSDYYTVKEYLKTKALVKKIFANPKRHEDLKKFIISKDSIKDEMTKISTDDTYAKALGA